MKARFECENPGFQDFDGLAYKPHVEKLNVSGPQLLDYTERKDAGGMLWYIGVGWILCPLVILALLSNESTRGFGVLLLLAWLTRIMKNGHFLNAKGSMKSRLMLCSMTTLQWETP